MIRIARIMDSRAGSKAARIRTAARAGTAQTAGIRARAGITETAGAARAVRTGAMKTVLKGS